MSFASHLIRGGLFGTVAGVLYGAYCQGASDKAFRKSDYGNPDEYQQYFSGIFEGLGAVIFPVVGPLIGVGAGGCLYGGKKAITLLRTAPKPIQVTVGAIGFTTLAWLPAYALGNKE